MLRADLSHIRGFGVELLHAERSVLRKVQGKEIGVVFQEPMSALNLYSIKA